MRSINSATTSVGISRVSSTIWSSVIGTQRNLAHRLVFDKCDEADSHGSDSSLPEPRPLVSVVP
jgi:hypothetical protein